MGLISYNLPNLVNGVSQQADILRRDSQGELVDNAWCSIADGLQKRQPIELVSKLTTDLDFSNGFVHAYSRDLNERYVVLFDGANDTIKVFDVATGEQFITDFVASADYLPDNCNENLSVITVDDYSFIVNKEKVVTKSGVVEAAPNPAAMFEVRSANYELSYKIEIHMKWDASSSSSSSSDADGDGWTTVADIITGNNTPFNETQAIAEALVEGSSHGSGAHGGTYNQHLEANLIDTGSGDWYIERVGNTIYIENTAGIDFAIRTTDGAANTALLGTKDDVPIFNDLPSKGVEGFTVKVDPDPESGADSYWVAFESSNGGTISDGYWVEVAEPYIDNSLTASTMPHVLIRKFDTDGSVTGTVDQKYFSFETFDWSDRLAGDEETSPDPSFVGGKIRDVFFFRDRLGLLGTGSIVMSQQGQYQNFYRTTVTTLLDGDPIDLEVSDNQVSDMFFAVPDEQDLILFSDQTQYVLETNGLLTPASASIKATTRYESSRTVKPLLVGDAVMFAQQNGNFVGVREYRIQPDTQKRVATENTEHVEKYIAGQVRDMTASAQQRCLVVATQGNQYVYVYQWFVSGGQKLQSAWHRWDLGTGDSMLGLRFIDTTLYFISQRSDGVYLEKIETEPGKVDGNGSIRYLLDRRVEIGDLVRTYDAATNTTTITLPYEIDNCDDITVVSGDTNEGELPEETYYLVQDCDTGEISNTVQVRASEFNIGDVFSTGGRCYTVICPYSSSSSSSSI